MQSDVVPAEVVAPCTWDVVCLLVEKTVGLTTASAHSSRRTAVIVAAVVACVFAVFAAAHASVVVAAGVKGKGRKVFFPMALIG